MENNVRLLIDVLISVDICWKSPRWNTFYVSIYELFLDTYRPAVLIKRASSVATGFGKANVLSSVWAVRRDFCLVSRLSHNDIATYTTQYIINITHRGLGPLLSTWINFYPSMDKLWPTKEWDKITYSFSKLNGFTQLKYGDWSVILPHTLKC